jgi:hypothetical protein
MTDSNLERAKKRIGSFYLPTSHVHQQYYRRQSSQQDFSKERGRVRRPGMKARSGATNSRNPPAQNHFSAAMIISRTKLASLLPPSAFTTKAPTAWKKAQRTRSLAHDRLSLFRVWAAAWISSNIFIVHPSKLRST